MRYDAALKQVFVESASRAVARLAGSPVVEHLNVEFATVMRRTPDLLARLEDGRLVHVEFQSVNEDMRWRMHQYRGLIGERFPGADVLQIVLYTGMAACRIPCAIRTRGLSFRYRVVDVRDWDGEQLLRSPSLADRVLAVLCDTPDRRLVVRRILHSLRDTAPKQCADWVQRLVLLSGLRQVEYIVEEEVRAMPIVIDPMENRVIGPWIRKAMERGRQEGIEQGLEQGHEQGLEQGQAELLLNLLAHRFGKLPDAVEKRVRKATAAQRQRWATRLLDARSLAQVFRSSR